MKPLVKQKAFCRTCGKEMLTDFKLYDGAVCDRNCHEELEWRKVLCMMGKEYYPDTKAGTYEIKNSVNFVGEQ